MNQKPVQPISFRIYPEGSFLYCKVNIWPTKRDMYRNTDSTPKTYAATCGGRESYIVPPARAKKPMRRTGLFAEADFYKGQLGMEVVSHEMSHAAFAFADRRQLKLEETISKSYQVGGRGNSMNIDGPEERFCYALGQMCRQFVNKATKLGLYEHGIAT